MNFKELLKNKKLIGGAAAVLVVGVVTATVLLLPRSSPPLETDPDPGSTVSVQTPTVSTPDAASSTPTEESKAPGSETEISDVEVNLESQTPTTSSKPVGSDSSKAEEPAKPVTPAEPEQPDNGNSGGIQIGGGDTTEEYNCGSKNHHCKGPESHAFILNLELEGCSYCGSHSCPSFYGTDQWGNGGLFPKLCPKYDEKKDPLKYCQKCGREMWSQSNPTGCFGYLHDTQCECGEFVEANTCHHH